MATPRSGLNVRSDEVAPKPDLKLPEGRNEPAVEQLRLPIDVRVDSRHLALRLEPDPVPIPADPRSRIPVQGVGAVVEPVLELLEEDDVVEWRIAHLRGRRSRPSDDERRD